MKRAASFTEAELARALRALEKTRVRAAIELTANGLRIVPLDTAAAEGGKNRVVTCREIIL